MPRKHAKFAYVCSVIEIENVTNLLKTPRSFSSAKET